MLRGTSIGAGPYIGPLVDAIEFGAFESNRGGLAGTARELRSLGFKRVSCHLPPMGAASETDSWVREFADGDVDAFVVHVTKKTPTESWSKHKLFRAGAHVLFENHNQFWHPTDAGWCWAEEFKPIADNGGMLCLDTGHILYACSAIHPAFTPAWEALANEKFEAFLELPIAQSHVHTVGYHHGYGPPAMLSDHCIDGFDIGPWVKKLVARHPDVALIMEIMDPYVTQLQKIAALDRWLA